MLFRWMTGFRHFILAFIVAAVPLGSRAQCHDTISSIWAYGVFDNYFSGGVSATLNCTSCAADAFLQFGPTTNYGNRIFVGTLGPAAAPTSSSVSSNIFNSVNPGASQPCAMWHIRGEIDYCDGSLFATNYSADFTFVTPGDAVITSQPQNQPASLGGNATFTVNVMSSYLPIYFQWMANGVVIPGATNGSYAVMNITSNDMARTYSVAVANQWGFPPTMNWYTSRSVRLVLAPALHASRVAGNIIVSWPASITNCVLQTSGGAGISSWTNAAGTVVTNGNTVSVALPATNTAQFFRLNLGP